jgi:hypothetical protein
MDIDYKRGNPLVLGLVMDDQQKINFAYLPPYLAAQLNNAFHRGLIDASKEINLQTSFEDIEAQYFQFGKNLTLEFQAKAKTRAFGEEVFMPTAVVMDLGQTVDMTDGALAFHHDSSSISDPKLRAAWDRGAALSQIALNSQPQKDERLKKEQTTRENQIAKDAEQADINSKLEAGSLKRSQKSAKAKIFFAGLFIVSIAAYFLVSHFENKVTENKVPRDSIDFQNKLSKSIKIEGIIIKRDIVLDSGDEAEYADWYFLKMGKPIEIKGSKDSSCNGVFKNIDMGIPGRITLENLQGKNIAITGDLECDNGSVKIKIFDPLENDGPLLHSAIASARDNYKNKFELKEAKRKADEKAKEDFLKTPEGQQALLEEMSRPKPIDRLNLKSGIEYINSTNEPCVADEKSVCLTASDYEYMCKNAKGLTRQGALVVAFPSTLASHLLQNGDVDSTDIPWIETSSLGEESRKKLNNGERLTFHRCEVFMTVSGIYKGSSARKTSYARAYKFVVNDSKEILIHGAF